MVNIKVPIRKLKVKHFKVINISMFKYLIVPLLLISSLCYGQPSNYELMGKELRVINSVYQSQYDKNLFIKQIMDKTMEYRLDSKLGKKQYATKDEIQGVKDFEELQIGRDAETIDVYKKFQPPQYVQMMADYNKKRKDLRIQLINKKITWRQFSDGLEDLVIKNRAKESEYRDKKVVEPEVT
jgi:hypothetical protein